MDKGRACIYSQLKSSSSEVAAMIEGLLRHCTDANVQANYTDTHGASTVGSPSPNCWGSGCCRG
ncbi:TnpA family transposase [Streptosporangium brasiliense]|uniref:TnpA family transposase n=1 Tax=Streptosporangium brasiliense TaxID=47480 RepID=A0ABT9RI56_9ACTN|nr:TnpA family transposase [Streptosporangium brasiliense]